MSYRLRIILLLTGLISLCTGIIALGYALWPQATMQLQSTLSPVLFTPP